MRIAMDRTDRYADAEQRAQQGGSDDRSASSDPPPAPLFGELHPRPGGIGACQRGPGGHAIGWLPVVGVVGNRCLHSYQ